MTTEVLRSDARRNRERIVASARRLFAARGVDVPVEEITRDAGLGMGTLYRHFPTKDDLIDAVLEESFAEYLALADAALAVEDPWAGLGCFLESALDSYAANRGLADAASGKKTALRRRLRPKLRKLAERVGLETDDLVVALQGGSGVIERSPTEAARYVAIVLAGLRSER